MLPGIPGSAMCVQRFDDSRNSAIRITYRILLRSSSMPEPRDPLLKVFAALLRRFIFRRAPIGAIVCGRPPSRLPDRDLRAAALRRPDNRIEVTCRGGLAPRPPRERFRHRVREEEPPPGRRGPDSVMILPQVHLRKPCYDFYFL